MVSDRDSQSSPWSKIASCLPGRTDNEIKNVWNTHLKKRLEQKPRDNETTTTTTTTTTTEDNSPSILHETIEIPCETDMDISSFLINDDQQQFKSGLSVCSDSDSISTFNFSDAINSFEDAEKVDAFIDIANLAIEPEVWSDVEPKGSKELMSSGSSCHEVADWLKQLEGELMKDANYDHIMDPFLIRDFNFDDFKINCFLDNDV